MTPNGIHCFIFNINNSGNSKKEIKLNIKKHDDSHNDTNQLKFSFFLLYLCM